MTNKNDPATPDPIIALIPAYNEGKHIADVIRQASQFLPVWVVDDGSSDDTAQHARAAGAKVIAQQPNQGKGAALMRGFRAAIDANVRALVMLDADNQHDPQEIEKFTALYHAEQPDLIIGQRDFRYMPALRKRTNTLGTWMFSWAMRQHIPDNQSGYRMLSQRMMQAMLESRETNFEFEVDMITECVVRDYKLAWVPIRTIYGDETSHIRPLRHAYHFTRIVLEARAKVSQAMRRKQRENAA